MFFSKSHAGTHEDNRLKICLFCRKKKKNLTKLENALIQKLKENTKYDQSDKRLPRATCSMCLINFYKALKIKKSIELPDYSNVNYREINTRLQESQKICQCLLCDQARNVDEYHFSNNYKSNKDNQVKKTKKNVQNALLFCQKVEVTFVII